MSRGWYYLTSLPTLLLGIRNWPLVVALFVGLPVRTPATIHLRNGPRFRVRTRMDVWIIKETCLDRDYERHAVAVQDGWTVVDIGGGLGDFAVCVAHAHPGCTVHAYEPFPQSYALLRDNLALNGVEDNVRAFPQAVLGRAGTVTLDTGTGVPVRHRTADLAPDESGDPGALAVASVTLDDALRDLPRCDFLKIDCEGGEYEILFNASAATLAKLRHVALEYHEGVTRYTRADLARFFEQHGFRVRTTPNPAHRHIGFLHAERSSS
jgi:FkbM family methyltransferase